MQISELKKALPFLLDAKITPLIVGHHGIGKTESLKQLSKENGWHLTILNLGTASDAGDIVGLPNPGKFQDQEDVTVFLKTDWAARVIDFAVKNPDSKAIIFLDEINRSRKDILQAIFSLILEKRINTLQFPTNVHVVAAMNPATADYSTIDFNDSAFGDRFCFIKLSPSVPSWVSYATKTGINSDVISFVQTHPNLAQGKLEDFNIEATPSFRTLESVGRLMDVSLGKLEQSTLKELVFGCIGVSAGIPFFAHIENKEKPLTAKDVLSGVKKHKKTLAELAKDPNNKRFDLLKSTNSDILSHLESTDKLSESDVNNLIEYIKLVPAEYGYVVCTSLYILSYEKFQDVFSIIHESDLPDLFKDYVKPEETKEE